MFGGVLGDDGGIEDYKFRVAGRFWKCLQRQVDEDIRMQEYEKNGGIVLNLKREFYTPKSVQPEFRQLWNYEYSAAQPKLVAVKTIEAIDI